MLPQKKKQQQGDGMKFRHILLKLGRSTAVACFQKGVCWRATWRDALADNRGEGGGEGQFRNEVDFLLPSLQPGFCSRSILLERS